MNRNEMNEAVEGNVCVVTNDGNIRANVMFRRDVGK